VRDEVKVYIPTETVIDEFVVVAALCAANGSLVNKGDVICEIETSKAVFGIESSESGYIEWLSRERQEMKPGDCVAIIHQSEKLGKNQPTKIKTPVDKGILSTPEPKQARFTKRAEELISELKLSREIFSHKDFVKEKDILDYLNVKKDYPGLTGKPMNMVKSSFSERIPSDVKVTSLSVNKLVEIQSLSNGQNVISSSISVKVRLGDKFAGKGRYAVFTNLMNDLTPFILKEICKLLKRFRELNAFYHDNCIYFYNKVNIGYALDLDKGLQVVNLGDLENSNFDEIKNTLLKHIINYKKGRISARDLKNSTFTITDLSAENVFNFTPLINKYQSAILCISSIDEYDMSFLLSLTFDHRVTEGKKAAQFLNELKKAIKEFYDSKK
jgi:pyruvate dehydrogenase E2 component (dihydrolipoamide acetyltransferase)